MICHVVLVWYVHQAYMHARYSALRDSHTVSREVPRLSIARVSLGRDGYNSCTQVMCITRSALIPSVIHDVLKTEHALFQTHPQSR
jgi:hypothetical protein